MEITRQFDPDDDWTGVASAAERKRRQNRLNQRARRKRLLMQRFQSTPAGDQVAAPPNKNDGGDDDAIPCDYEYGYSQRTDDAVSGDASQKAVVTHSHYGNNSNRELWSHPDRPRFFFYRDHPLPYLLVLDHRSNRLPPGDLANIVRLNVLRALAINSGALGIPIAILDDYDAVSPVSVVGPLRPQMQQQAVAYPLLAPTALQRAIPHHPWVDLLPVPRLRDNILLAIAAGTLDEDEMCYDISELPGGTDDSPGSPGSCSSSSVSSGGDDDGRRGALTVWGESWEARNWEYNPAFLRKWSWLFDGCPEIYQATNSWRARRGERPVPYFSASGRARA